MITEQPQTQTINSSINLVAMSPLTETGQISAAIRLHAAPTNCTGSRILMVQAVEHPDSDVIADILADWTSGLKE